MKILLLFLCSFILIENAVALITCVVPVDTVKEIWINKRIPAITSNNPGVFAAGYFGYVGMGVSAQHRTRVELENKWVPDGNAATYIGLGNPQSWIGVGAVINLYGLSNKGGEKNNFGEGSIDLQLSRAINNFIYIGVGGFNLFQHNTKYTNALRTFYATASVLIPLRQNNDRAFGFMYGTLGIGNGIFQKRKKILNNKNETINWFGSLALQILPEANLIVEWSGVDLTISAGLFPLKKIPLHILVGVADINFDKQRYIASIGYSFQLFRKKHRRNAFPSLPVQSSI